MSETVIEHGLGRLNSIGINHIFRVPGDFAFSVHDVVVNFQGIEWVGCCNELNAGYVADGYARIHGLGALYNLWSR
jgi:indolepyruvate decarboxylase